MAIASSPRPGHWRKAAPRSANYNTLRWAMNEVARVFGVAAPSLYTWRQLREFLEARGGSQRSAVVPAACANDVVPAASAGRSARSAEVPNV